MPNWCFTQMIFHGEQNEMRDFYSKIHEWTSQNYQENGFGPMWLGNVLHGAGLGNRIDVEGPDWLRCRGSITFIGGLDVLKGSDEALFNLDMETAWAPMTRMWSEVVKHLGYKSIGFSYHADEPGCEVYETYDPYGDFPEEYYVDIFVEGEDNNNMALMQIYETREYLDDDSLRIALQEFLETDETDLSALMKSAENYNFENEDTYLYIHKYDFVDAPSE